jgi:hypothetical protein
LVHLLLKMKWQLYQYYLQNLRNNPIKLIFASKKLYE